MDLPEETQSHYNLTSSLSVGASTLSYEECAKQPTSWQEVLKRSSLSPSQSETLPDYCSTSAPSSCWKMGYPFFVHYDMVPTGTNSGGLEPLGGGDLLKEIAVWGAHLEAYSLALPPVFCLGPCSSGQAAPHLCCHRLSATTLSSAQQTAPPKSWIRTVSSFLKQLLLKYLVTPRTPLVHSS